MENSTFKIAENIYLNLKKAGRKRITVNDLILGSLTQPNGTLDQWQAEQYLIILQALEEANNEEIEKAAKFYFRPSFPRKKQVYENDILEDINLLIKLKAGKISPSKIVGTGYKNARNCALNYLKNEIARNFYIINNWHLNQV